ncbi:MAG: hypothetical protein IJ460_08800, partial [Clostridia bacterium]|nr:hypothetical protein [Clostridia bacterium]
MKKIISSILIFAMLFTLVPTVFAESVYEMNFGETTYTVAPGEEIKIPLYFNATADPATAVTVETVASYIMIPEEISLDDITIESTVLTADDYNKDDSFHEVVVIGTVAGELNNTTPIITMTVKAPAETGEYKFEMYDSAAYYKDTAGKEVKYQGVGEVPTTLIVEENVTPQPPASEYDYEMKLVPSATEVEAGSTFTLPLYFVYTADTTGTVTVETVASYIMIPEEISLDDIIIESTVLTADDYNKDDSY